MIRTSSRTSSRTFGAAVLAVAALALPAGCQTDPASPAPDATSPDAPSPAAPAADAAATALQAKAAGIFQPLPLDPPAGDNDLSAARTDLGRMLYFDTRLSKNHDVSCNSCHQLDQYGVDNKPTSSGHKAQLGGRNSPTVYNAALHFAQFWDGRAADVEEQAGGPMVNPVEMAMADGSSVTAVLKTIPGYAPLFAAAFPGDADPVSYENAAVAIGAFERKLITPGPFDEFLTGNAMALDAQQQHGLEVFMDSGCHSCHQGAALGGTMYQKLGLVHPYETADLGRQDVTGDEADKHKFKVPSLRNTEKTGPWFHDGSIATLDEAVQRMAWHQTGKELDETQVQDVVAFLSSLTGRLPPSEYIATPELPASGPETPAPDPS
ncbi:MAG: c-type cytochrome [Alphaproteobacteria bacterium]|nr:c-type cytochrome [Alphaproteobacteria bacterium]